MPLLKHTYIYNIILSIGIGLLIIYFLPSFFSKYQVSLVDQEKNETGDRLIWYADLNNDSVGDKIYRGVNGGSQTPYIKIEDKGKYFKEQWNIVGEWIHSSPLMIGDYDENGYSEAFALSFNNDSVFLNGYEPYKKGGLQIRSKFVFKAFKHNQNQDWYVYSNRFVDLNNDGFKELVFSFLAGFTKQPRQLVAYDIKNDSFVMSQLAGLVPEIFYYSDIDTDGQLEIFGKTYARDNYNDVNINLIDTNSYLLIYDNKLELKFPPDTNYGVSSNVFAMPFNSKIVTLWVGRTSFNNSKKLKIYGYDNNLSITVEEDISTIFSGIPQIVVIKEEDIDKLYLISKLGQYIEFDENLDQVSKGKTELNINRSITVVDIENDGTDEIIVESKVENKIIVFRQGFTHPVDINIGDPSTIGAKICVTKTIEQKDQISIHNGQNWFLYDYFENPNYIYRWPIYSGIIIFLFIFFQLLFLFYRNRIQKQFETERKLLELQLLTVKNQMNPHFTFNALNSISSIIYKEDKKLAHDFLTRFSDLIRSTLQHSEKISVTLDDELKFVKNYLALEKFRFKKKFDYHIEIKENVDLIALIPRMIIQTFIENALKHGLMHKEKDGLLNIRIWKEKGLLMINIEDNGIGRKKAEEVSIGSTGKGLKIIEQIIHLYKKLQGKNINYKIIDLYKNEVAAGTKVTIEIGL